MSQDSRHKKDAADTQKELECLQAELHEAKDQHLRVLAEADNMRKRLQREKDAFTKFAAESLVRQLLPLVDSLDQALSAVDSHATSDALTRGVELIQQQLVGVLKREGVERIPAVGEIFDPNQHEAVEHVEAGDGIAINTIVEEVHAGFMMHGQVLRPAMVKVAKAKADGTIAVTERDSTNPQTT